MAIDPSRIVLIAIFLLVAFPVHEFSHAYVAYRLGDATAKMFGRLTLNPVVHFDPIGGMFLVLTAITSPFIMGWAKPTPVNPSNLRDRRNGEVYVALAGPASNLLMAVAGAVVVRVILATQVNVPVAIAEILILFVQFNIALAIFNMIPIPPLDGSTLLFRVLDPRTAWQLRPVLSQYGFIILILLILLAANPLGSLISNVTRVLVGF